jgi:hypothetical protein
MHRLEVIHRANSPRVATTHIPDNSPGARPNLPRSATNDPPVTERYDSEPEPPASGPGESTSNANRAENISTMYEAARGDIDDCLRR